MKILRLFGLTGLVIYAIFLMVSCGRGPENGSGGKEYLNAISSMSTSIINKLKGTPVFCTRLNLPHCRKTILSPMDSAAQRPVQSVTLEAVSVPPRMQSKETTTSYL